jgi:hypothetical protein
LLGDDGAFVAGLFDVCVGIVPEGPGLTCDSTTVVLSAIGRCEVLCGTNRFMFGIEYLGLVSCLQKLLTRLKHTVRNAS